MDPILGQASFVTPTPGLVDQRPVSVHLVRATADPAGVSAELRWWSGVAPCTALDSVQVDEDELRGALRRSLLLLAAGGDPHRTLELDGRAVVALAGELDRPERRDELAGGLTGLRADSEGLPGVGSALDRLLDDGDLAWHAYAAGLIGEELGEEG